MTQDALNMKPLKGGQFYLVLVDGSETSQNALNLVVSMAKPEDVVEIFQAVEAVHSEVGNANPPEKTQEIMVALYDQADKKFKAAGKTVSCHRAYVEYGKSVKATILDRINLVSPDIVALGSRGLGAIGGCLLGSVSNYIVQASPKPVLVAK